MLNDLLQACLFLLPIGAGVALLVVLGRDRDDASFDLADCHDPAPDDDPTCRYVVADGKVSLKAWAKPDLDELRERITAGLKSGRPEVLGRPATMLRRIDFDISPEPEPADILPPAPAELDPDSVPWKPPYAELQVDLVARRYGDNPADTAARWLRELGEQARAQLQPTA